MSDADQPQGTIVPVARAPRPIDPNVSIGHVHLRTADIDRVRAFAVDRTQHVRWSIAPVSSRSR